MNFLSYFIWKYSYNNTVYLGLLALNEGRKQKASGDNTGYFLTAVQPDKPQNGKNSKKNRGNAKARNNNRRQQKNKGAKKQKVSNLYIFFVICSIIIT